jgi:hypothetical protein
MSIKAINWAWSQKTGSTSAKLLLLALADHTNDDGWCWPGRRGLAEKVDTNLRNITKLIKKLIDLGLIQSIENHRPDGSQSSNYYFLVGVGNPDSINYPPSPFDLGRPSHKAAVPARKNDPRTITYPPPATTVPIEDGDGETVTLVETLFPPGEIADLKIRYPGIDLEYECNKMYTYYIDINKSLKSPRTAFKNWLARIQPDKYSAKNVAKNVAKNFKKHDDSKQIDYLQSWGPSRKAQRT